VQYNLATCLYPTEDLSTYYLTVKQILEGGIVAEAFKTASVGDWGTSDSSDSLSGDWAPGDDVGGAIACLGWIEQNQSNQLLIYAVDGALRAYWLQDGTWTHANVF
jgi:hypothetical protein